LKCLAPRLLQEVSGDVVMVESVTASLAAGIVALVLVAMATTRAIKRRTHAHESESQTTK